MARDHYASLLSCHLLVSFIFCAVLLLVRFAPGLRMPACRPPPGRCACRGSASSSTQVCCWLRSDARTSEEPWSHSGRAARHVLQQAPPWAGGRVPVPQLLPKATPTRENEKESGSLKNDERGGRRRKRKKKRRKRQLVLPAIARGAQQNHQPVALLMPLATERMNRAAESHRERESKREQKRRW